MALPDALRNSVDAFAVILKAAGLAFGGGGGEGGGQKPLLGNRVEVLVAQQHFMLFYCQRAEKEKCRISDH